MLIRIQQVARGRSSWALAAAMVAGCGPIIDVEESGGEAGASSDSGEDSDAGSTTGTTSATSTGPTTSSGTVSSGTVSTSSDDTGTTGTDACPPIESISGSFFVSPELDALNSLCIVTNFGPTGGGVYADFDCGGEFVTVNIASNPHITPRLNVGDEVEIDYEVDPIFWTNRWLSIRNFAQDGQIVFAAVSGSALDPPGMSLEEFFQFEIGAVEIAGLCELVPGDCATTERTALDIWSLDGPPQRVFDRGSAVIDAVPFAYQVLVQNSTRNSEPFQCTDIPGAWYEVMLTLFVLD